MQLAYIHSLAISQNPHSMVKKAFGIRTSELSTRLGSHPTHLLLDNIIIYLSIFFLKIAYKYFN